MDLIDLMINFFENMAVFSTSQKILLAIANLPVLYPLAKVVYNSKVNRKRRIFEALGIILTFYSLLYLAYEIALYCNSLFVLVLHYLDTSLVLMLYLLILLYISNNQKELTSSQYERQAYECFCITMNLFVCLLGINYVNNITIWVTIISTIATITMLSLTDYIDKRTEKEEVDIPPVIEPKIENNNIIDLKISLEKINKFSSSREDTYNIKSIQILDSTEEQNTQDDSFPKDLFLAFYLLLGLVFIILRILKVL